MQEIKDYNDKNKMYDIMNTTQSNYSNMLKRLQRKKSFSNFVISYYSIALIVYSLTAVFFPEVFDEKLSSYFNIILSIVVLTYSLIITNAKYSERIQAAEWIMNEVKARNMQTSSDICVMQHLNSRTSVIMNVSITKKWEWRNTRTGIIRKNPIERICGINSFHLRQPRKSASCWIKHGNLFTP